MSTANPPFTGTQTGHFVKAKHGVRLDQQIDGCIVFPHKDGYQPAQDETCSYEFGFRIPGKTIMIVRCLAPKNGTQPVASAQPAAVKSPVPAAKHQAHASKHAGRNKGDRGNRTSAQTKSPAGDDKPARSWQSASQKQPVTVPATHKNSLERARAILQIDPDSFEQSQLLAVWASKNDSATTMLTTSMSAVLSRIDQLERGLSEPVGRLLALRESTRQMADELYRVRKERDRLLGEQKAITRERIAALGQRLKRLKAQGDQADAAEKEAVAKLTATFADRQATQSAAWAKVKLLLDGSKKAGADRGLEWEFTWEAGGLLPGNEALAAKEAIIKDVTDAYSLHEDIHKLKVELAGIVNAYDNRLAEFTQR